MMKAYYTRLIKQQAARIGFDHCGISMAAFLKEEAPHLNQWLNRGLHAEMSYMERHTDKRLDPALLVPGAKSVISLLMNYYQENKQAADAPKIACYAFGEDYHNIIWDKLDELLHFIKRKIGDVQGRGFTDSAPVLERAWAAKSGLGWIGKNTCLIRKGAGSYFFIAELIVDVELVYDPPSINHCGSCTACMDACPTAAIISPYVLEANLCISYLTIEKKGLIPDQYKGKFKGWLFGCDICQQVCPWNRFASPLKEARLQALPGLINMNRKAWKALDKHAFKIKFGKSPLMRTGLNGIQRNLEML